MRARLFLVPLLLGGLTGCQSFKERLFSPLTKRLDLVNSQLGETNQRLVMVNDHLGTVNTQLGETNHQLKMVNDHLGTVNTQLDETNARLGKVEGRLVETNTKLDGLLGAL